MKTKTLLETATARPWDVMEGKTLLHIETANLGDGKPCGMPVCSIPKKRMEDAQLIVQAVNEYEALCAVAEACKFLLGQVEGIKPKSGVHVSSLKADIEIAKSSLSTLAAIRKGAQ